MKPARDEFIADLRGIKDRNQAETLKGTELFVTRDRLPQPQENEIYLHDLLGKRVMHEGVAVGVLTGFQNFGAGELLELDTGLLIPALFITSNETDVVVALPEDFLEDAARP